MRVKLLKKHTHAGREYAPGAVLDLREGAAEWLVGNQVAEKVADAAPPTADSKKKEK